MHFTTSGPEIPDDLVHAQEQGTAVFLCGAGISRSSGLPSFEGLVRGVYVRLGEDLQSNAAELAAFKRREFDRALRLLERRISSQDVRKAETLQHKLRAAVAAELRPRKKAALGGHKSVIQLSQSPSGLPCVVTTNFDTLFEAAAVELGHRSLLSHSGTGLPAPGSRDFQGVLHLHGRIADGRLRLSETEFVLTSAEFGDAYLRSGWASRWVYDLVRTRTVVLVGYGADDPPMRYLLEALDADRDRYSDLKPVFAFVEDGSDQQNEIAQWEAKGVRPIVYDPADSHRQLYDTLAAWAGYAADPKGWRKSRLESILPKDPAEVSEASRAIAFDLLRHASGGDLLASINPSPAWIEPLQQASVFQEGLASAGAWVSKRLNDRAMIVAVLNHLRLADWDRFQIGRALDDEKLTLAEPFRRAWRAMLEASTQNKNSTQLFQVGARIEQGSHTASVLKLAADALRPRLRVHAPFRLRTQETGDECTFSSLIKIDFQPEPGFEFFDFGHKWKGPPQALADLVRRLTGTLFDSLEEAEEFDFTGIEFFDQASYEVHSVEKHPQDQHSQGFYPLVRVLADCWDVLRAVNQDAARQTVLQWRQGRFALSLRLWLFAFASEIYSSDEAAAALMSLSDQEFWSVYLRRESMRILSTKWADISPNVREGLAARLVVGPPQQEDDETPEQSEESASIRDNAIFIRLARIEQTAPPEKVPDAIRTCLLEIQSRHPRWETQGERDEFISWSETRWGQSGDVEKLKGVPAIELVEKAISMATAEPWEQGGIWEKFCAADPEQALRALEQSAKGGTWNPYSLRTFASSQVATSGKKLPLRLGRLLLDCPQDAFLKDLPSYSHWFMSAFQASRVSAPLRSTLDRIWDRIADMVLADDDSGDVGDAAFDVLNTPGGHLGLYLVRMLGNKLAKGSGIPASLRSRYDRVAAASGQSSVVARAALVQRLNFLHWIAPTWVNLHLVPRLEWGHSEASSLWTARAYDQNLGGVALFGKTKYGALQAIQSAEVEASAANRLADFLVLSLIWKRRNRIRFKIQGSEIREALRHATSAVRNHVAWQLGEWLGHTEGTKQAEAWTSVFGPVFSAIWPLDANLRDEHITSSLVRFAVAADAQFPDAVQTILPYLVPSRDRWSFALAGLGKDEQDMAARFPRDSLVLIDALVQGEDTTPYDLRRHLERIEGVEPSLASDPRFKRLSKLAVA